MGNQIVVSGNRVLAHGEDCFNTFGDGVFCSATGRIFEHATAVNVESIPSDIDSVGYEYHAGEFVPCAPFGEGDGNIAVLCNDACKALKDSGVALSFLQSLKRVRTCTYTGTGNSYYPALPVGFTPAGLISFNSDGLAISTTAGGIYISNGDLDWFTGLFNSSYNNKKKTYNAIAFE